jgi:hypothetical protein
LSHGSFSSLTTVINPATQGVGTKMGTAECGQSLRQVRIDDRRGASGLGVAGEPSCRPLPVQSWLKGDRVKTWESADCGRENWARAGQGAAPPEGWHAHRPR